MKIVTSVTGKIPEEKQEDFLKSYNLLASKEFPEGLELSMLTRNKQDKNTYTIISVWASIEALEAMRRTERPKAVLLFEELGVSPSIWIHEILSSFNL
jgi:quinol monooxygenase YgiN